MRPTAGADKTQSRRFRRQRLAVERGRRSRHADVTRDRADRRRRVAGKDLELDVLGGEERNGIGRVRPQPLGEQDEAERLHAVGERRGRAVCRERRVEAADRQHAAPRGRLTAGALCEPRIDGRESFRRTEHEPHVTEVERTPAAA